MRSKICILFTRPRRMGKSLNMDMLATFLDCKQDTTHLFKGLYIENSPEFANLNLYPVVYLDFVNLDSSGLEGLKLSFRDKILKIIKRTLKPEQLVYSLNEYINNPSNFSPSILASLNVLLKQSCFNPYSARHKCLPQSRNYGLFTTNYIIPCNLFSGYDFM